MRDISVAVLIVTYNRLSLLEECIDAIDAQTYKPMQLCIVDNASTDGTGAYLAGLLEEDRDYTISVITTEKNLGGAGGYEVGVGELLTRHDYDFLLFMDDDAILERDFLEKMVARARRDRMTKLFAGAVKCDGIVDTNHRRSIRSRLIFSERWMPEESYESDFRCELASFCGLMIEREILEGAGVPRGDYYIWYDDSEYCLRCERVAGEMGYNTHIHVVSAAVIDHRSKPVHPNGSILLRTDWRSYYGWRNRFDVAQRYLGDMTGAFVKLEYRLLSFRSRLMRLSFSKKRRAKAGFNIRMIADVMEDIEAKRFGEREEYRRGQ